jgi:(p)ppGpp synthase/HD superfamily hydrolase
MVIDGRIKRLYSIWQKLGRQKIDLDQVYDFVALRIITHSVKDCYATLGIIHNTWSPVPGRIKDFIAMPRPNGYQSLHTSVISERGTPFEVQIRTDEMHQQAEEGIAAHWKYKEGRIGDQRDERYFQWMRQLLEWQQEVRDPQEFINNLKIDLYPEEVYIFTPRGEGEGAAAGRDAARLRLRDSHRRRPPVRRRAVNGKMVPLRTRLKNGEIVEIITQAGHTPSRDWLNYVVTSRARQKIRHFRPARGEGAEHRARTKALRQGREALRPQPEDAGRERRVREGRRGVRQRQGGRSDGADRVRTPRDANDSREAGAPKRSWRRNRPKAASRRSSGASCGQARTASRSTAWTICWSTARAAAIRFAARRSSATSAGARASPCTRRPVRT